MKVCKKCKGHVSNKSRICPKCGADVSKARIINNNCNHKKSNVNQVSKTFNKPIAKVTIKPVKEIKPVLKKFDKEKVIVNKIKSNKKSVNNLKCTFKNKFSFINKKISNKFSLKRVFDVISVPFVKLKSCVSNCFRLVKSKIKFKSFDRSYFVKLLDFFKNCYLNVKSFVRDSNIFRRRLSVKSMVLVMICLLILGGFSYLGVDAYMEKNNSKNETVEVREKATTEKIFSMGDLITYNGVDYKIVKVETSEGNYYKTPEDGNQFLIVTVYIKNNTGAKIPYSYVNWTMSNSKDEEKKIIFTSINVDDALYSGDLVIGGIKTGSMVFEQPINDPKLRMNFYELKKDENGEDVIDYSKKVFSVSVKVPDPEEDKDSSSNKGKNHNDSENVKTVKTSEEKNS